MKGYFILSFVTCCRTITLSKHFAHQHNDNFNWTVHVSGRRHEEKFLQQSVSSLVGVYVIVQSTFRNLEVNFQYWPESFTYTIICLTVPLICRNYLMSCKKNEKLCNNSLTSFVNTRFFPIYEFIFWTQFAMNVSMQSMEYDINIKRRIILL
jgi:hypothetical protein